MAPVRVQSWRLKLSINLKTLLLEMNDLRILRFMAPLRAEYGVELHEPIILPPGIGLR